MKKMLFIQVPSSQRRYEQRNRKKHNYGITTGENVESICSNLDVGHGFLTDIGNNATITNATILSHDASIKDALGYTKVGRVSISDDVFIGMGAIILPGAAIGNRVIVGASCVVSRSIPSNSVVSGNPARFVCTYDKYIAKHAEQMRTCPVYDAYRVDKTETEKKQMKQVLAIRSAMIHKLDK